MTRENRVQGADADLQMLTAEDVASALQISVRGVWRLVSSGRLPAPNYVGRLARWPQSEFKVWLEQGCPAVNGRRK